MNEQQRAPGRSSATDRRTWMKTAAAAAVGAAALQEAGVAPRGALAATASGTTIKNGRIKQSLVHWCYEKYWNVEEMIQVAKKLGCESIELIAPKYFPLLKQHGLKCAIGTIDMAPDPPFVKGFNNPKYHDQVFKATRDSIDACSAYGYPAVICFTGMSEGIPADVGAANCVDAYKKIVGHAEKKNVVLCLEMLNTRDRSHPMKGHPGYQGDHIDYCVDIIKRVGSTHLRLLFDIYHAQIMDGDIIRRLREHREVIGHIHTAGNPGRGELDDKQEIAYKPIMEALIEIGYKGYVGQEFIPTRDPLAGLEQAVALCDV